MSNLTQALKDLYTQLNNGEIDKNEYDRQKKFLILNMSGTQEQQSYTSNNPSRTTTSNNPSRSTTSKNPSRRQPVNPNYNTSNQNNNMNNNVQMDNNYQEEEPQEEMNGDNKPKAVLYGQVTKVTKNSINLNKYERRDPNTNPIVSRTSFDPNYGFGKERTGVADVDDMLDYLQKLDELLQDVETSQERYQRLQNELPSGVFVSKDPKNLKNEESVPKKLRAGKILLYAEKNRVKKIEQYLDMGVSVNYQDHDTGNSPLITAAVYGQREALYFLVERGANVNLQNEYGDTALHELIKNRRENLAIWLIKHGADIFIENKRTFTPYDLALPWFQRDMKKITAGVDITQNYTVKENVQTSYTLHNSSDPNHDNGSSKVMKENPKPIKIFLKNQSYKNVMVTSTDNSTSVLVMMGEKMGLSKEQSEDLQLIEHIKGKERKLLGGEKILEVKRGWPLIVDQGAKIDPIHFRCEPKSICRNDVREAYHKYINT